MSTRIIELPWDDFKDAIGASFGSCTKQTWLSQESANRSPKTESADQKTARLHVEDLLEYFKVAYGDVPPTRQERRYHTVMDNVFTRLQRVMGEWSVPVRDAAFMYVEGLKEHNHWIAIIAPIVESIDRDLRVQGR